MRAVRVLVVVALLVVALAAVGCSALPEAETAPPDWAAEAPTPTDPAQQSPPENDAAPEPAPQPAPEPPAANDAPLVTSAVVVRVVDGDTAVFSVGGVEEKVRFIGIDTPESTNKTEPYGKEASAYTANMLTPGREVWLERDAEERDRYQRLLAYVWLAKPGSPTDAEIRAKMLNARLATDGYAQQMTIQPNSRYAEHFTRYVREAREAQRGLWALPADGGTGGSAAPSTAGGGSSGAYIGNARSKKFHVPSCSSVGDMAEHNKVAIKTRAEAVAGGYDPCGRCRP
jgi:micrococcal nuclease